MEPDCPPPTILIVDDSEAILMFLRSVVEAAGMTAVVAQNAADAQACIDRLGCRNLSLVVLDVFLQQAPGPNGYDLYQAWLVTCPELPVVLMSGSPRAAEIPAVASGTVPFISKPFNLDDLVLRLLELVHRRDATNV